MSAGSVVAARRVVIAVVALGLLLFAIRSNFRPARELPVINSVPLFEFTDQAGRDYGSAELGGKIWLASLLYTTCPGPCPRLVSQLGSLMKGWRSIDGLRFVSFTVDPSHDSPGVLADYAEAHGIEQSRWALLTADEAELFPFIRKSFLVEAASEATELDAAELSAIGIIAHSLHVFLVDGSLQLRGIYDTTDATAMRRLQRDVILMVGN